MTDWQQYRKCPICAAPIGQPCTRMTGRRADGTWVINETDPHRSRKHRAGGGR